MALICDEERIRYLSGQIAGMFGGDLRLERLGNVALEVMVARENAEEIVDGDYSRDEKERAQKTLRQLREMQRNVVRLYVVARLRGTQKKKSPFMDYIMNRYSPP